MNESFKDKSKDFKDKSKEFVEQVEVAGDQLVAKVKELIADSSTKRIVIRNQDDKELFSIPMNVGVVGGGIVTLAAPLLAAIGAVAALVSQVKIDIVRDVEPGSGTVIPGDLKPDAEGDEFTGHA